jgi:hypothetical protein
VCRVDGLAGGGPILEHAMHSHRNTSPISDDVTSVTDTRSLTRMATLVADGTVSFLTDLDEHVQCALAKEVRKRRRTRLIEFLVKQIAWDIHRLSAGQTGEEMPC